MVNNGETNDEIVISDGDEIVEKKESVKGMNKKDAEEFNGSDDCYDIIIPNSFFENPSSSIDCSVVLQIPVAKENENEKHVLDFEGQSGAIGRFEVSKVEESDCNLVLDFQGYQYHGKLHPGPTCMAINFTNNAAFGHNIKGTTSNSLKVDAITNEFMTLKKTKDIMKSLNAQILEGTMDEGYQLSDDDVNARTSKEKLSIANFVDNNKTKEISATKPTVKRKRRLSSKKPSTKQAKST